jgi:hypothetical protein
MKSIILKLPEYSLIVLAFLAGYSPPFYMNPVFIGIIVLLILQIIFKNKFSGILLGVLFVFLNLFFLGALLSEFNEFTEFTNSAKKLLFVGLAIWIVSMILSFTMIYKYSINSFKSGSQIKLEEQK